MERDYGGAMAEKDKPLTFVEWVIVILASIGFAFDTYELLMLPLVLPPAIQALGGYKFGTPEFSMWRDLMFYLPAVCGGIFGLLGGYLTDRFGRRAVLVGSILLYAVSAGASAFATSLPILLVLRCMTFVGVCVEFVAAVAWLAELFPNPARRERILGITQAFSSLGGVMVTAFFTWVAKNGDSLPAILGAHDPWRYTLMSGLIPALPLIILRPFMPESPVWLAKRQAGTLKRPSVAEIFAPALRQTTVISTVIFACSLGAAFGAIQQMPQIVPGLAEVSALPRPQQQVIVGQVQFAQEMGGLMGRIALAGLALFVVSRQNLLRAFQIPGLIIVPLVFFYAIDSSVSTVKIGIFLAGFFTVAQLSFWGNYLPRVYPTHLRGTGESFAANVGGRLIGTFAAVVTGRLAPMMPGETPFGRLALAAAAVALVIYAIGLIASFKLPEPTAENLPD
jgi:MFS family permease